MKFSESWLREWVNPDLTREDLSNQLAMAGLEVESITPAANAFSGVVIGQIVDVQKHPDSERLQVCKVNIGSPEALTIVCGASNARVNLKVAAALENAVLSNNLTIKNSVIRGVASQGMLCSTKELGLQDDSEGLLELMQDAPIGKSLWEYLNLADFVMDVSITPNRGDCLSILGMAKEIAALTECDLHVPPIHEIIPTTPTVLPIVISEKESCPCYVGRIISEVNAAAASPVWLSEKLRRSHIRSINAVVDVMNYVMLELGQPMHAFSLDKIKGGIEVRKASNTESLKLLDSSEVSLNAETLIIADQEKPLAIAGVMGGMDSGVILETQDIFLESAYFQPSSVIRSSRKYHLNSDSSFRFERGIDPTLQRLALERATELLLSIVGGKAGPLIEHYQENFLPQPKTIELRSHRISKILGYSVPEETIEKILHRLGFSCEKTKEGWRVIVSSRRSDIHLEVDLIEEVARLYGYNNIPSSMQLASLQMNLFPENKILLSRIRLALCDQGYHEVVTYSFIDKHHQELFIPGCSSKELLNPVTSEMGVMRASLWPGLVNTLLYNQNRQQMRVRIFEMGLRFVLEGSEILQQRMLSGLVCGSVWPEQWGAATRIADFFDVKNDILNFLKLTFAVEKFIFKPGAHPALHPGQSVEIWYENDKVGMMGGLHPSLAQRLKTEGKVFLFELFLDKIEKSALPQSSTISKFPEIRRDIAIVVSDAIPFQAIQDTIRDVGGELLKQVDIFDLYQGKGIVSGNKSVALALTLQHSSRTLIDEEVTDLIERVVIALKGRFNAELRG